MERYGKDTIEISESMFYWNSIIACELINLLPKGSKPLRQLAGLYFTDQLLTLLNFDVDRRIAFYNDGFHAYAAEHNLDNNQSLKEKLKEDNRENAGRIKEMLHDSGLNVIPDRNKIAGIIDKISNKHKKDLYKLNDILQKTKSPELNKTLRSQIHLFFIRLFEEDQRTEELIMYNRLYKYYFSKKVRGMQ
jgi:thiopeptide-type bacteriocin biosynthesis protein